MFAAGWDRSEWADGKRGPRRNPTAVGRRNTRNPRRSTSPTTSDTLGAWKSRRCPANPPNKPLRSRPLRACIAPGQCLAHDASATARDIIQAFYDQGLGALVPLVIVLLVLAVVLSVLTLAGPVIPFIYPLF